MTDTIERVLEKEPTDCTTPSSNGLRKVVNPLILGLTPFSGSSGPRFSINLPLLLFSKTIRIFYAIKTVLTNPIKQRNQFIPPR
jgi:hypothetical protein